MCREDREHRSIGNVWYCMLKGDSRPFVELFGLLVGKDCPRAAQGLLRDLAQRIVDGPYLIANSAELQRFSTTGRDALRCCLHHDPAAFDALMHEALRMKSPRSIGFQFSIAHMMALTMACAVGVSFAGNISVVSVIYFCFLMLTVPLYARALFLGSAGNYGSAKSALLISVTISIAFLLAMSRPEIRDFYPLPLWMIPVLLFVAAAVVFQQRKQRFLWRAASRPRAQERDLVSAE